MYIILAEYVITDGLRWIRRDNSGKLRRLFTCMNCSGETVFDEKSNLFKCTYCGAFQIIDVNNVTTDFCLQNLMKKNHLTTLVTSQ